MWATSCRRPSSTATWHANVAAGRASWQRAGRRLVLANHAIMGGPVAAAACAASATALRVKLHGSELEYAIRGEPRLAAMARRRLDGAAAVFAGSQHIVDVAGELLGDGPLPGSHCVVPPGVDMEPSGPTAARCAEARCGCSRPTRRRRADRARTPTPIRQPAWRGSGDSSSTSAS